MAVKRRGGGGRPAKGERHAFMSRMSMPVAEKVVEEADARGMSWGEYIEAVCAIAHGFDVKLPERADTSNQQEALGISA